MTEQPAVALNDGNRVPQFGLGVWQVSNAEAPKVVTEAIAAGYRLIDTAASYGNEAGVGEAIRVAGLPRQDIFVTTKLANDQHGYDQAFRAFDQTLKRLRLDYVDLYLIHWPKPKQNAYAETWRAFIKIRQEGRAKSIGVSNFNISHLERILKETGVVPAVNQVELHPRLQQKALRDFHARHGIATESWSPLGRGRLLDDPTIARLAKKHRKTSAQIILRWHIESGLIVIPKSVNPARLKENIDIFDFRLDADDMATIAKLDANGRTGPDPETFT